MNEQLEMVEALQAPGVDATSPTRQVGGRERLVVGLGPRPEGRAGSRAAWRGAAGEPGDDSPGILAVVACAASRGVVGLSMRGRGVLRVKGVGRAAGGAVGRGSGRGGVVCTKSQQPFTFYPPVYLPFREAH